MPTTTNTHSIVLQPGEFFSLPSGATIVFSSDADSIQSDCADIPDANYKCGYFYIIIDQDENDGHSMDEFNTLISNLQVGNTNYAFGQKIIASGDDPGTLVTTAVLNSFVPDQSLFSFKAINRNTLTGSSKRQLINIYFQVLDSLYDEVEMKVDNRGSAQYYKPIESTCEDYPTPS